MRLSNKTAVCVVLAGLLLVVQLGTAQAQQSMEQKKEAKLAEAWVKKANWITDYDKARAKAKESGKLIFAYFSRSYSP